MRLSRFRMWMLVVVPVGTNARRFAGQLTGRTHRAVVNLPLGLPSTVTLQVHIGTNNFLARSERKKSLKLKNMYETRSFSIFQVYRGRSGFPECGEINGTKDIGEGS